MKLTQQQSTMRQIKSDAVVAFIHSDKKLFQQEIGTLRKLFGNRIDSVIELEQFKAKESELLSILTEKKLASPRLYLVGLGEVKKTTIETHRRAAATATKRAQSSHIKHLSFAVPTGGNDTSSPLDERSISGAIAEGAILSHYAFDKYITESKHRALRISECTLFHPSESIVKTIKEELKQTRIIADAVILARDLSNAPASEIYPETLAETAKSSAEKYGYSIAIWDKKKIEKEGFGGLLAVNAGSARPPRFLIMEHNPKHTDQKTIVLVGKGITFDSGGISIKPSSGMAEMKMDMSGAAAVIGTMEATARLNLPVRVIGLVPATENLPSGSAMKPGDIVKHYGGKTSEVDNTDAEGRLILADALAYACTLTPDVIIDLATLTGACVVALGQHATGMMGTDEETMTALKASGEKTYERVWQLPLFEEYEKQIKSDIADVKNVGGRWGGAITAGLFLKKFVGDHKWVHLDIAGTAMLEEPLPYAPKGGSGVGVRLLVEYLRNIA
jgi:leucyl aminopeptidase